ncbi:hypothetical protein NC796_21995 [Aliifodinibius sp. S!AR15-10]|uniref:hypothetical protein n=1 Tax=Aliifodinibius sp. S!AR15-10 TaxID=2950437 RepID=UPI0028596031|nr:hypothetical protein [Aliifodinibius sp. S!AR15-10]MDR8393841.1 hypothetical protein [Aliifodinibius sp. S!AR15-10]
MKRKKLKFMNIGGQVLTRSDMKNIMAGSGGGGSAECQACLPCFVGPGSSEIDQYICCMGYETCETGTSFVQCDNQPALTC